MADGITQGRESVFVSATHGKNKKTHNPNQNHPHPTPSLKERAKEEASTDDETGLTRNANQFQLKPPGATTKKTTEF
jgi:hypothetical protein